MQTVIIDTDIAIDYLRGMAYAKTFVDPLLDSNNAFISVLSVLETVEELRWKQRHEVDDNFNLREGEVIAHSKDKSNIYEQVVNLKGKKLYIEYTAKIPEDLAVVL